MTAPAHDHNAEVPIKQMVYNRLPFLEVSATNDTLLSTFTMELMYEFEPCFKIDPDLVGGRIGFEENYSVVMQGIIADVIAAYILMMKIGASLGGDAAAGTVATTTYLSKAKAGSVEVEYDQFDIKKGGGMAGTPDQLLNLYTKSAIRKAHTLGCIIDICADCAIGIELMNTFQPKPFIVVTSCGCGC